MAGQRCSLDHKLGDVDAAPGTLCSSPPVYPLFCSGSFVPILSLTASFSHTCACLLWPGYPSCTTEGDHSTPPPHAQNVQEHLRPVNSVAILLPSVSAKGPRMSPGTSLGNLMEPPPARPAVLQTLSRACVKTGLQ